MGLPARALVVIILLATSSTAAAQQSAAGEKGYQFTADWTTPRTGSWMKHLQGFVGKPDAHGLEVGCFEGRSTIWFLENVLTHPTSHMTCIDVFTEDIEKRFDHNIEVSGLSSKVTKLKGYSQDVLRTLDYDSVDFAYIDGCHLASCVLTDAVLIWDPLKTGGVMIFDDYLWRKQRPPIERPQLAIDAFLEIFSGRYRLRNSAYQVIIEKTQERSRKALVGSPIVHTERWKRRKGGSGPRAEDSAPPPPSTPDPDRRETP
jgi:predicted O-methyltransferase YrrM